ncbi:MAG TPA: class I SAM-dependent methyltransferase [Verrucomicrobiae bacterium]|nr:class I SAM-dependent methyltransferase [Verrucomicrobiae bacterium]
MSSENDQTLPPSTCAYERYDPATLLPLNEETYVRLQELGWSSKDFQDQTVLDIGCNSGLLTMHALQLGARSVEACDVQQPFLDFVAAIVAAKGLPVTVNRIAFDQLTPSTPKVDVVLFMEVLHWAVAQGMDLRDVISRLSNLTGKLLYLEFPWSVSEPSIQNQTKLTADTYSADAVLDELMRHFQQVRVVRFMRYFGFESGSQRVLVEARSKRPEAGLLAQLPGVYSLDWNLSLPQRNAYLLSSSRGPLVAKSLGPHRPLTRLPTELRNEMFDAISSRKPKTLVAPIKYDEHYLLQGDDDRSWMVFPFIGPLPLGTSRRDNNFSFEHLVDLLLDVRRDLRDLSANLLERLYAQGMLIDFSASAVETNWRIYMSQSSTLPAGVEKGFHDLSGRNAKDFDAVCHGDLRAENFILTKNDRPRAVGLENICMGTIYSDGLSGLIRAGAPVGILSSFCDKLAQEESRQVAPFDICLALANVMADFPVRQTGAEEGRDDAARWQRGLDEGIKFSSLMEKKR